MRNAIILRDVSYIDVVSGKEVNNTNLIIENGVIQKICKEPFEFGNKSYETIDCSGKIAVPGLFECHAHLCSLHNVAMKEDVLKDFVKKGITQVRDVGGPFKIMKEMKDSITKGKIVGPEIFYSGPILQGGKLSWQVINESFPGFTVSINSREDVNSILNDLYNNGASLVKTFSTFDKDVLKYLNLQAKKRHLKIAHDVGGLIFNSIPVELGLDLGIDCFEHGKAAYSSVLKDNLKKEHDSLMIKRTPKQGQKLFKKLLSLGEASISKEKLKNLSEKMIRNNAYLCPTLMWNESNKNSENEEKKKMITELTAITHYLTKKMIAHGVKMLVGIDSRTATTLKEMTLLHNLGLSNLEILRGATIYPAEWLQISDKYGSIDVNKKASLLVLNRSPLDNINNIEDTAFVLKEGEIIV